MTNFATNVMAFTFGVATTSFFVWVLLLASNFNGF